MTKAELIAENEKLKSALEKILFYTTDEHHEKLLKNGYVKEFSHAYPYSVGEISSIASHALEKDWC